MKNKISLARKLLALGLSAICGILIVVISSYVEMNYLKSKTDEDLKKSQTEVAALMEIKAAQTDFMRMIQEWKNILVRGNDPSELKKYSEAFNRQAAKTANRFVAAKKQFEELSIPSREVSELFEEHRNLTSIYHHALSEFNSSDPHSGKAIDVLVKGKDREVVEKMESLVERMEKRLDEELKAQAQRTVELGDFMQLLFVAISCVVGTITICITVYVAKSIKKEIGGDPAEVAKIARSIALGDLSKKTHIEEWDEGSLLASIMSMKQSLREMVAKISESAKEMKTATEGLSSFSSRVARTAGKQAESTETMAAAVEEMSVSIATVSDNADATSQMAKQACELAANGNATILETISAIGTVQFSVQRACQVINDLGSQSLKISGIAGTIKEIADQTNLLALNAAIEAARAGDAGRGFAVVADEVRQLAEKTARSTTEIAAVIKSIQDSTESAVKNMNSATENVNQGVTSATTIEGIMDNVDKGARTALVAITEIAEALKEQSAASHDLAKTVEGISQAAEQNGSFMNNVAQQATEVQKIVYQLERLVGRFCV